MDGPEGQRDPFLRQKSEFWSKNYHDDFPVSPEIHRIPIKFWLLRGQEGVGIKVANFVRHREL
jgi:hypothetical protein